MSQGRIAFQGELGANSHEACAAYFPDYEPVPHPTFDEAFEAIKTGDCQLGMIPVENSIAGRVADVHHLLPSSGLKIIGEKFKPIRFQLMVNPGVKLEEVTTVQSMAIAISQCRKTVKRLGLKAETVGDTAGAARMLAQTPDRTRAAISPALAAEIYGLEILLRDIEDERHNTTRFLVMTAQAEPEPPPFTSPCITSFVFRVRNLPAALYKALGGFATNGVNMTKLESYMEDGAWTATFFYAEVDGRPEDRGLALALEELQFFSERFEILGVYPADPFRVRA
ncbi:MAG: prephenate dehydratase [Phenylobacterium sp.]|uniref:prephenate dehydratase n=1 Tax=Phenylobacterium sp. TaxID=1871053 RepID=UPI0027347B7F|nr:prephenate dehydratase [Phenylobacterium sp.]MDP1641789.1 prephenate dehydratase [Phenylobacterium sp.]MDP3115834.1 prephenate dehydratase [Phenylobacterium sp.]